MEICKRMYKVYFEVDETVFEQGDPGDSFFYILAGTVKVLASKNIAMTEKKLEKVQVGF